MPGKWGAETRTREDGTWVRKPLEWAVGPWIRENGVWRREPLGKWTRRGLPGSLLIVFVALKLTGVTDWSWWWALSPMWLPLLALLAAGVLMAAGFALVRWLLLARAWVRFRRSLLPELALADPVIRSRIEAERQGGQPGPGESTPPDPR